MTVIVPGANLSDNNNSRNASSLEEQNDDGSLNLDGGFAVPDSNAFGHSFRNYDKDSERRASVEEFYRLNHINQTYEFVRALLLEDDRNTPPHLVTSVPSAAFVILPESKSICVFP